jgi:hypothetical protein
MRQTFFNVRRELRLKKRLSMIVLSMISCIQRDIACILLCFYILMKVYSVSVAKVRGNLMVCVKILSVFVESIYELSNVYGEEQIERTKKSAEISSLV